MTKLIRFDEDHFGILIGSDTRYFGELAERLQQGFEEYWPGKKLIVMMADEFIDLTGQYEIVKIDA